MNIGSFRNDFWEYDPITDAWISRANFGGTTRYGAIGFGIGGKGYIGTGNDGVYRNDFWEFNPVANAWTAKANFGGVARYSASGFATSAKGYIGLGNDGSYLNDFWEYYPGSNSWTQRASFAGSVRENAAGFTIGLKGYVGGGLDMTSLKSDFWEYNPILNYTWSNGSTADSIFAKTSGTYTVTISEAGCSTINSKAITVITPTLTLSQGILGKRCNNIVDSLMATSSGTVVWSPTTGLFTNLSASVNYTSTISTKVFARPLNTTKYYASATQSGCTVTDSIIDSVRAGIITLVSATTTNAVLQCPQPLGSSFSYYGTAANPDQWIFAIDTTTATGLTNTMSVDIDLASSLASSFSSSGANQEHASYLMRRRWNVNASPLFTGTAKIRFYYQPSDTVEAADKRNLVYDTLKGVAGLSASYTNPSTLAIKTPFEWLKTVNVPLDATWLSLVVGNRFPPSHIKLVPTYGTQDGIHYVEFSGITSFSGGTGGAGFAPPNSGGASPLTLSDISVTVTSDISHNTIKWTTSDDENLAYYQVEYSYDNIHFYPIPQRVEAKGLKTTSQYQLMHDDLTNKIYYRIRLMHKNEKITFSSVRYLEREIKTSQYVNVYPNPIPENGAFFVELNGMRNNTTQIRVRNTIGQSIYYETCLPTDDRYQHKISLPQWLLGQYILEIKNSENNWILPIIK